MFEPCNFYSLMWRLDKTDRLKAVNVLPKVSTAFPVYDAASHQQANIELNYLTMLGVDSPLPHYLITLGHRSDAFKGFLGLFHQRIALLLYHIWQKTQRLAGANWCDAFLKDLVGGKPLASPYLHFGVQAALYKTSYGLRRFVALSLKPFSVTVIEHVPYRLPIHRPAIFGVDMRLGENALLGAYVVDQNCCIHILIENLLVSEQSHVMTVLRQLQCLLPNLMIRYEIRFTSPSMSVLLNSPVKLHAHTISGELGLLVC